MIRKILGLHHITLVCADAQRTVDFYTQVLGLRFVKKTVNFDDPGSYHLYFGDEQGRPGTLLTFFEWPTAPQGQAGIGGTRSLAFRVASLESLLQWKRRLQDRGISPLGPTAQEHEAILEFRDPDGVLLEITAPLPAGAESETAEAHLSLQERTWPQPADAITTDMTLTGGVQRLTAVSANLERTHAFYTGLLGLRRVHAAAYPADPAVTQWVWAADDDDAAFQLAYLQYPAGGQPRARIGIGQTHHFALAVADEDAQQAWREKILQAGIAVTPVIERVYFKSIYLRDPDGHIIELATAGPGFAVDEALERLGEGLQLPPWLESTRGELERVLRPLSAPPWKKPVE